MSKQARINNFIITHYYVRIFKLRKEIYSFYQFKFKKKCSQESFLPLLMRASCINSDK